MHASWRRALHRVGNEQCVSCLNMTLPTEPRPPRRPQPGRPRLCHPCHLTSDFTPKQCSLGKTMDGVNRHKQDHILTLSRRPDVTERDTWRGEKVTRLSKRQGCLRCRTRGLKNGRLPTVMMDTWLKHGLLGAVGGVDVLPGTVPSGSSGALTSGVLADLTWWGSR